MAKIPSTKSSRIAVGDRKYKLEPAKTMTHYGEHHMISGGQPFAFHAKRADDAWFVLSDWSGKKLGLIYQWSDGKWSFQKIDSEQQAPQWLRAKYNDIPATIYNLSKHLISGSSAVDAIAHAEGITVPPPKPRGRAKKKPLPDPVHFGKFW